ncbi:hypothetical protein IMY05_018G0115400 [Salix suchowensis]|nr:hypothetical protein IMY05_018G0115400 [Salix suchowensis]
MKPDSCFAAAAACRVRVVETQAEKNDQNSELKSETSFARVELLHSRLDLYRYINRLNFRLYFSFSVKDTSSFFLLLPLLLISGQPRSSSET